MAVTKYYKSFDGEDIEVKQSGEVLTDSEESALRQQLGGDFSEVEKPSGGVKTSVEKSIRGTPKIYTQGGRFRGADYKKGVNNDRFRAGFANTNNFNEKVNFLDKSVGQGGYVVDKQQNFLLTPDGQRALGYEPESENLLAIDSDKFEGEDFIDLIGEVGAPMLASIAGSYAGMAASGALLAGTVFPALTPFVGFSGLLTRMVVGAGTTGAAAATGTLIDEGQQWMRGISEEAADDVIARAGREAGYAAVGETLGLGVSRLIGRGLKSGPRYLSGEAGRLEDVGLRKDYVKGLDPKGDGTFGESGGIISPYYGEGSPGGRKSITRRMTQIAQQIFRTQEKIDKYNEKSLFKQLKKQVSMDKELNKEVSDEMILNYVREASGNYKAKLSKSAENFSDMIGYRVGAATDEISNKIIAGKEKAGMNWYDDLYKHYNELQDYVAVTSTLAFDDAQKRAFQIFKGLKPEIDKSLTKIKPSELPKDFTPPQAGPKYPEGFDARGVPQFKEIDQRINQLKKKKTLSAPEKNTLNYLENLQGSSEITGINKVPPVKDAEGSIITRGYNQITREPINVLNDLDGNPVFAYSLDEANEQIKYILPTNLTKAVQDLKKTIGGGLRLSEGPLKTIWDLPQGGNVLMSPTEMNSVVQQMRKITIAADGERFNPTALWDAALDDVAVSNAQLSSMARMKLPDIKPPPKFDPTKITPGQQKRLDDIPKKSPLYKKAKESFIEDNKRKGGPTSPDNTAAEQLKAAQPVLKSLEEYSTMVRQITQDNRNAYELFEGVNVTALADQYVAGKANAIADGTLFNKVVGVNSPRLLENFLDSIEKIRRRKDMTIYTGKIGDDVGITDPTKLEKIDTINPKSQIAREIFETQYVKEGDEIVEQTFEGIEGGRGMGLNLAKEGAERPTTLPGQSLQDVNIRTQAERSVILNQIDQADPKELRELVRQNLYEDWLKRVGAVEGETQLLGDSMHVNLEKFADDIINKSRQSEKGGTSVLRILTGDNETADMWLEFANTVKKSDREVAQQFINTGFKEPIIGTEKKTLKEMVEGIGNEINYQNKQLADEFFKDISSEQGFNIGAGDQQGFINSFSHLDGKQISEIIELVPETELDAAGKIMGGVNPRENVRRAITTKLFEPLFDANGEITKDTINNIGNILGYKGKSLSRVKNPQFTKAKFNALYGEGATNPYDKLDTFWKNYVKIPDTQGVGGLVAAGLAASIAGIPIAFLFGPLGVAGLAALSTKAASVKVVASAMGNPKFLKTLAEVRFPDEASWRLGRTSEKFEQGMTAVTHALRNSIREQQDDAERRFSGARMTFEGATESAPNMALGDVIREQGVGVLTKPSALPQVAKAAINTLGGKNSGAYRNLPNVQSFNVDTNIFQELERRKALAGNNPNTQALIDRGR